MARLCTVCLGRDRRVPATQIAAGADGLQWFECDDHGPEDNLAEQCRVSLEPIAAWFARNGLPVPK
jgi:hypothetical protein